MAKRSQSVFIGLGSNLGNPKRQLKRALVRLKSHSMISMIDYSSVYRTAPIGYDEQPCFLNMVAHISTQLHPIYLLKLLQSIENQHLRKRSANQNAARTLDLDILMFDNQVWQTDVLIIPHPRMFERRFVLEPLLEISPCAKAPGEGFVAHYLSHVDNQPCQKVGNLLLR